MKTEIINRKGKNFFKMCTQILLTETDKGYSVKNTISFENVLDAF